MYKDDSEMGLTLVSPGIIQVVEYRNQNIKHITALQDKKQEFLWKEHNRDFVEQRHTLLMLQLCHFSPLFQPY